MRLREAPVPRLHPFGGVAHAHQSAVRHRLPIARHGHDHLRRQAVIRIVVDGDVVARVFGFALRPDFPWPVRVVLVRQDEVEAALRPALVADADFKFLAAFGRMVERNNKLHWRHLKFRRLAAHGDARDGELHRIKGQPGEPVAQHCQRMRHLAQHFALFHVKPQRDARVLQVVVAPARVGLVGAPRGGPRQHEKNDKRNSPRAAVECEGLCSAACGSPIPAPPMRTIHPVSPLKTFARKCEGATPHRSNAKSRTFSPNCVCR